MASITLQRLQKKLLRLISVVLTQRVRDSRLHWVTILDVQLTPDLSYAKIYFNYAENGMSKYSMVKHLTKASGFIKSEIAAAQIMRVIPQLSFHYDETADKAQRLDELFDSLNKNKTLTEKDSSDSE